MKTLIIDRSKWRTGGDGPHSTGTGFTALLNPDGFMCCLGFVALSEGQDDQSIFDIAEPASCRDMLPGKLKTEMNTNTSFTIAAIDINDSEETTNEEKEEEIISLFGENGIQVEFVGEYVKNPKACQPTATQSQM